MAILVLLSLLLHATAAAAAAAAAQHAAGESAPTAPQGQDEFGRTPPEAEQLIQWIRDNGGEVNVVVRTVPGKGRHVIAPRAFKKGDVLARIPNKLTYPLMGGEDTWAAALWEDFNNPRSFRAPFWRSQPARDAVWSLYDIPRSYLTLIQSPKQALEQRIMWLQDNNLDQTASLGDDAATPADDERIEGLRYAMSLIHTRRFGSRSMHFHSVLVPLLELANHAHPCTLTHHVEERCDDDAVTQPQDDPTRTWGDILHHCTVWKAAADIAAGQELCNSYRFLTSDMALLQYGFLQDEPRVVRQLARFDRHDFDVRDVWGEPWFAARRDEPVPFEPRNATEGAAELVRLARLLEDLLTRDAQLARCPVQPHPRDAGGRFLRMLLEWRAQRAEAVRLEMQRLLQHMQVQLGQQQQQLAAEGGAGASGGSNEQCEGLWGPMGHERQWNTNTDGAVVVE